MHRPPPDHRAIYDRNADLLAARRRTSVMEEGWIARFAEMIAPGGHVLDLGCGSGRPMAAGMMARGLRVTGLDFSDALLRIARAEFPQARWVHGDMRDLTMADAFDGILGWHSFFHLTGADQRALLPRLAAHLRPGGALMLTVGHISGEAWGRVGEDEVFHASLEEDEYRAILKDHGVEVVDFVRQDPTCGLATVLLGQRAEG